MCANTAPFSTGAGALAQPGWCWEEKGEFGSPCWQLASPASTPDLSSAVRAPCSLGKEVGQASECTNLPTGHCSWGTEVLWRREFPLSVPRLDAAEREAFYLLDTFF